MKELLKNIKRKKHYCLEVMMLMKIKMRGLLLGKSRKSFFIPKIKKIVRLFLIILIEVKLQFSNLSKRI